MASEEFENNGCSDLDLGSHFDHDFLEKLVREYHVWNGDPESFDLRNLSIPDYAAMSFLASKLDHHAEHISEER